MTVQQLIDKLNTIQDKDTIVVMTNGYEGGYDDINDTIPEPITIALNVNNEWYYGNHERVSPEHHQYRKHVEVVKAIVI